jgi:hypothetical protein
MFDKNVIVIFVLALIILFVWNYDMPVVEGAKFNNQTKNRGQSAIIRYSAAASVAAPAAASVKAPAVASVAAPAAASVKAPATIETAAQTPLPIDFNEVKIYLDKLKTYSEDAKKMADSVKSTTEEYSNAYEAASSNLTKLSDAAKANVDKSEEIASKIDATNKDITRTATDIQAQVNSNNIVKNDIVARINEMKDIDKNVSSNAIEVKNSAMNAQNSAEDARKALAGILPTAANNVVLQSGDGGAQSGAKVEGFSGFKSSVLEGYTVYSNPNSAAKKNAFELENELVIKINNFNTAYYNKANLTTPLAELNAAIEDLRLHIVSTDGVGGSNKISKDVFDDRHNTVKTTAAQIDTLRADLDMKMQEIIKTKHGVPMDHTMNRDTAAYTTILWTALATSALYFVFVKMD